MKGSKMMAKDNDIIPGLLELYPVHIGYINRHYRISIAVDADMTQEAGQVTSLYHTISFGLVAK